MKYSLGDITLVITPFILTAVFVIFGYYMLTQQTPEARITVPPEETGVEIIKETEFAGIAPKTALPKDINGLIVNLPQNSTQLANILAEAENQKVNLIYITVPVSVTANNVLELTLANQSSKENVLRWAKKTINSAHSNGYHVVLAMTLNATSVIDNPQKFVEQYSPILADWSALATETSVSFFYPGIAVGHPLYSEHTPLQVTQLMTAIQNKNREKFMGLTGFGLCCTAQTTVRAGGYAFMVVIPTPEFDFTLIQPLVNTFKSTQGLNYALYYDREHRRITTKVPVTSSPQP